ncbi:MAG: ABC transporter permease [Gammaproteobacteria bacterium]|nr:ABC transporter permease [Gammaproteobacteria bacterium]MDG0997232.1 ABC transporter permease [Gammaproteobacteria bacterium]
MTLNLKSIGPFIALVLIFLLGVFVNEAFLSSGNLANILARSSFIGIVAIGATFVITAGGIDLSVGSMAAFISGCMILLMNVLFQSINSIIIVICIAVLASITMGLLAGLINGLLTTKAKIEAFIVTLGTMGIYRSLVTFMADGGTLSLSFTINDVYSSVYYGDFLGIPYPVWVFFGLAVMAYILMNKTIFGRHLFAVGSSEKVSLYSAIDTEKIKILAFMIQGFCVSIATIIYVPRLGSASGQTGVLWELEAIAAVIIGGTALKGGYGRVWGTVAGALILTLIGNILNLTDMVSNYLNGAVQGLIIIAAVVIQQKNGEQVKS